MGVLVAGQRLRLPCMKFLTEEGRSSAFGQTNSAIEDTSDSVGGRGYQLDGVFFFFCFVLLFFFFFLLLLLPCCCCLVVAALLLLLLLLLLVM